MRRQNWIGALALAVAVAAAACSRGTRPATGFNGAWRLDTALSVGVPAMMRGHTTVIHLTAQNSTFTIAFIFDGNPMNISTFQLDGQQHPLPLGGVTGQAEAQVGDGGRAITIEIHRPAKTGAARVERIVFTLQPDGQTIRRVRTVPGGKEAPQIYVYRRITAA